MALVLALACVQLGSCLCASAGLLCVLFVLLLALPVRWLPLLLSFAVAAAAVHGCCRLRRPIARRLPTTAATARSAVLLLLPLLAVLRAGVGRCKVLAANVEASASNMRVKANRVQSTCFCWQS